MKIVYILSVLVILSCVSCNNKSAEKEKVVDKVVRVQDEDIAINNAIAKAKSTLPLFDKALNSTNEDFTDFAIKAEYVEDDEHEHIWLNNISKAKGFYYGTINNTPESITYIKLGDRVKVNVNDISDWVYYDKNDKAVGGYTIRVFRSRMQPDEMNKFDIEMDSSYVE
ncbi:MAG: DUF2314 domain-containing protein [Sphingobacteriales bacterium JAD_PAG50586_3]|nr:MAG: DUF2314 domain-containing protein [Sphingobacteriales bacterium JAD_PAG50586_3]